jgi:hypothetical protein
MREPRLMATSDTLYRRHRFPAEIISHCVWLYFRFCLSYRDIEELMLVRGVFVTYEAIRQRRDTLNLPPPQIPSSRTTYPLTQRAP